MEILKIIGIIIGFLLMVIAVISIFDARKLTKKLFSFSDQNEGSKWMKIGGFLLFIVGILILYFTF